MKILFITTAVIIADDKVLLLRRKKDPYRSWWAFPGGKVEFGESIKSAMTREIAEETGLKIHKLQFITTINERVLYAGTVENQFVIYYWKTFITFNPEVQKDTREGELKWFSFTEIPFSDVVPSDRIILEKHIAGATLSSLYECVLQRKPNIKQDSLVMQEWKQQ